MTEALVDRILMEEGAATGVVFDRQVRRHRHRAVAEREVVLCAGAVASPQILLQSGIGDAAGLKALGIAPVHHLPGVGENLHDHLFVFVQPRLKKGVPTLNRLLRSRPRLAAEVLALRPLPHWRALAHFVRGLRLPRFRRSEAARPDIEITFRPLSFDLLPDGGWRPHPYPGGTELGLRHPAQEPRPGDSGAGHG